MKKLLLKKLPVFAITAMFFCLPQLVSAQKNKPCPKGYKQECYLYVCPLCARGTWTCVCVPNGNGNNVSYNATSNESVATIVDIKHPSIVSIKIFDATGRLIRTLAENQIGQGQYQFEWDKKNEQGNAVSAGIYILKFNMGANTETRKISIVS